MIKLNRYDSNNNNNNKVNSLKIFDWIKASKIIKEHNIQNASMGLDILMEKTYIILKNGKPVKNNKDVIFLSYDANPVLINNDTGEIMNCFILIYNDDIKLIDIDMIKINKKITILEWPKEALEILNEPFYYKNAYENKFHELYLKSLILYF